MYSTRLARLLINGNVLRGYLNSLHPPTTLPQALLNKQRCFKPIKLQFDRRRKTSPYSRSRIQLVPNIPFVFLCEGARIQLGPSIFIVLVLDFNWIRLSPCTRVVTHFLHRFSTSCRSSHKGNPSETLCALRNMLRYMKYLSDFSPLFHRVDVLRTRHKNVFSYTFRGQNEWHKTSTIAD